MTDSLFPNREGLRAFLKANGKELCERCGCCELVSEPCDQCGGEGVDGHDCGEDTCCCAEPEDDQECDACDGRGYFMQCSGNCDEDGHARETDDRVGRPGARTGEAVMQKESAMTEAQRDLIALAQKCIRESSTGPQDVLCYYVPMEHLDALEALLSVDPGLGAPPQEKRKPWCCICGVDLDGLYCADCREAFRRADTDTKDSRPAALPSRVVPPDSGTVADVRTALGESLSNELAEAVLERSRVVPPERLEMALVNAIQRGFARHIGNGPHCTCAERETREQLDRLESLLSAAAGGSPHAPQSEELPSWTFTEYQGGSKAVLHLNAYQAAFIKGWLESEK